MAFENYTLYRLGSWLAVRLPSWLVLAAAGCLAELNFLFSPRLRRGVYANLDHALPAGTSAQRRRRIGHQVFRNFAYSTADFFRTPQMRTDNLDRFVGEVSGWEHLQAAQAAGAGAVLVTVHMGSWELAGAYLALRGIPLSAAALPHQDPRIDRIFLDRRKALGIEVISVGGALRKLGEALTHGRFVAMASDRDVSGRGLCLPFLGQVTRMPVGHAVLALNSRARIIPLCVYKLPDRRTGIEIRPPIVPDPAGRHGRKPDAALPRHAGGVHTGPAGAMVVVLRSME